MSISTAAKNTMLGALDLGKISLHTAFPGATGANEVAGGSYAATACTFGSASSGQRALSAAVTITVPACTVKWAAVWNAGKTTLQAYAPNGGVPFEFWVDVGTDTVSAKAHGLANNEAVVFYGDTVPSPLVEGAEYFVRDASTDSFKLAATAGGAVIDLTSQGGSACVAAKMVPEVYAGSGTHTVNTWMIGLPN